MLNKGLLWLTISFILLTWAATASELAKPEIPKAKGEQCVAETSFMRRNHMDLLQHDRDKTVRHGQRDVDYSLKECIACHAVDGKDGKPVSVESPKHFCRACHDYAAVTVDCFQCHTSKPEKKIKVEKSQ